MSFKAVFFDRDGVVNYDHGYVGPIEDFDFIPGVKEALREIRRKGYRTVLCTNQSGIARGRYAVADFWRTTLYMQSVLRLHDAAFDAVYFCPHHPEAQVAGFRCDCDCRKPKTGMFARAIAELDLDPSQCAAVGDRARDLLGPRQLGVPKLYLVNCEDDEIAQAPFARVVSSLGELAKLLP